MLLIDYFHFLIEKVIREKKFPSYRVLFKNKVVLSRVNYAAKRLQLSLFSLIVVICQKNSTSGHDGYTLNTLYIIYRTIKREHFGNMILYIPHFDSHLKGKYTLYRFCCILTRSRYAYFCQN